MRFKDDRLILGEPPSVCLNRTGLAKLKEARRSGVAQLPDWLRAEMENSSRLQTASTEER